MAITVGWGSQWETLANAISNYYGGGVGYSQYEKVAQMLNSGNYTMEEMESILAQIPEFDRTYNANGELIRVAYRESANATTSTAGSVAQQVNSNVANSTQTQFSTVQTMTKDAQTGKVSMSDSLVKYKTGQLAPTTMKGVAISTVQGVLAASAGITVGKTIAQTAYDHGFNYLSWAGVTMEDLNPASWSSITDGDDSLNAQLFNMILGIDDTTKNPQMYMDEEAFAYMIAYLSAVGVFNGGNDYVEPPIGSTIDISPIEPPIYLTDHFEIYNNASPLRFSFGYKSVNDAKTAAFIHRYDDHIYYAIVSSSRTYNDLIAHTGTGGNYGNNIYADASYTFAGQTVYYEGRVSSMRLDEFNRYEGRTNEDNYVGAGLPYSLLAKIAWVMEYGIEHQESVEGITDQPGATQFNDSGLDPTDIAAILAALKLQFPELWEERVEVSPDGTNVITYIPVAFPTGGVGQMPTTDGATQSELAPDISGDGDNATDELIKTLIDAIQQPKTQTQGGMESDTTTPTKPVDPNGDPRGDGENPPIVPPVGSASALWKIYNPSQSQLDTFGAWLWSSNFVDQLLKLFNDPMQAIIGLHKVYCTPPTSGSGPIKVGYLVSDANANYVSNQYTEVDCGSVDMKEHFNNAFDYDDFTRVSIFLPFIGFKDLDVKDIMRSTINVKYGIDVLTGACLAKIIVTRDLNSPILYTFSGNCAVQYPVSSGSYIGIITGLCSLIGGVAGSLATGGALAPALVGATAGLPRMHTNVEHSGSISANAGALGPKKPYIVIQRPQTHMPLNGLAIEGEGQNETVTLGTLTGYVKVKKADLMGIPATGSELDEIRDLLEAGIYMY